MADRTAFEMWCEKAEVSAIHCLKQMAKTIRKRMDGLLTFWKHDGLTNASQEGFNNKIGWLSCRLLSCLRVSGSSFGKGGNPPTMT